MPTTTAHGLTVLPHPHAEVTVRDRDHASHARYLGHPDGSYRYLGHPDRS
ncbi:hypothetical protein QFZ71_005042 [Streptomyces sp. V2I9]|nr:hypothetical protein [Streptomyces sp. V2I9]